MDLYLYSDVLVGIVDQLEDAETLVHFERTCKLFYKVANSDQEYWRRAYAKRWFISDLELKFAYPEMNWRSEIEKRIAYELVLKNKNVELVVTSEPDLGMEEWGEVVEPKGVVTEKKIAQFGLLFDENIDFDAIIDSINILNQVRDDVQFVEAIGVELVIPFLNMLVTFISRNMDNISDGSAIACYAIAKLINRLCYLEKFEKHLPHGSISMFLKWVEFSGSTLWNFAHLFFKKNLKKYFKVFMEVGVADYLVNELMKPPPEEYFGYYIHYDKFLCSKNLAQFGWVEFGKKFNKPLYDFIIKHRKDVLQIEYCTKLLSDLVRSEPNRIAVSRLGGLKLFGDLLQSTSNEIETSAIIGLVNICNSLEKVKDEIQFSSVFYEVTQYLTLPNKEFINKVICYLLLARISTCMNLPAYTLNNLEEFVNNQSNDELSTQGVLFDPDDLNFIKFEVPESAKVLACWVLNYCILQKSPQWLEMTTFFEKLWKDLENNESSRVKYLVDESKKKFLNHLEEIKEEE